MKFTPLLFVITLCHFSCQTSQQNQPSKKEIQLIILDPGHFHAALVQKEMYTEVDTTVMVYAPDGPGVNAYLSLVDQYNTRAEKPTHWAEKVYTGEDYVEKMLADKQGNVVVLAGNNIKKTSYITQAVNAGLNVLGDKPMAINVDNFALLEKAFADAANKNLLLYDIMTERFEITNILQKELINMPSVFGELTIGTLENPAVIMESVHFYYKYVSGKVLQRPTWFFDAAQQGDAIADVGTHLVDLVQWQSLNEQSIDYKKDINVLAARAWPTPISKSQFTLITASDSFPDYLKPLVQNDTILQTRGNGSVNYTLKNIHVKLTARWNYQAPTGSGDTHYALYKGTKAHIEIRQGKEENYQPTLYILPGGEASEPGFSVAVQQAVDDINKKYPGITAEKAGTGWKLIIPQNYAVGHEAHFAQVMQRYLQYVKNKNMPAWEVPNMLAKYYTTTKAVQMANK